MLAEIRRLEGAADVGGRDKREDEPDRAEGGDRWRRAWWMVGSGYWGRVHPITFCGSVCARSVTTSARQRQEFPC